MNFQLIGRAVKKTDNFSGELLFVATLLPGAVYAANAHPPPKRFFPGEFRREKRVSKGGASIVNQ
jgi:hypothetical protein